MKCPILCKQKLIVDVCREKTSFYIEEKDGKFHLSKSLSYYYIPDPNSDACGKSTLV